MKTRFVTDLLLKAEQHDLNWLRRYTDRVVSRLRTEKFDEPTAVVLLEEVRQTVLQRFPGKESAYRLIYERRFKRILQQQGIFLPLPPDFPNQTD